MLGDELPESLSNLIFNEEIVVTMEKNITIEDGRPVEQKSVPLDMSSGNQEVVPTVGYVMSRVVVGKPDTFVPEHIKKDVEIGGIVGTFEGSIAPDTEQLIINPDFSSGNQDVYPTTGKLADKVTLIKPVTMVEGNIADGVTIAGVSGTLKPQLPTEAVELILDLASGDQTFTATSGKTISGGAIKKPTTLTSGNILNGINIAGVVGGYVPPVVPESEEKVTAVDFSGGDQVVLPTAGKVISKNTLTKPAALTPPNIRKDAVIAGIVGTMDAGLSPSQIIEHPDFEHGRVVLYPAEGQG